MSDKYTAVRATLYIGDRCIGWATGVKLSDLKEIGDVRTLSDVPRAAAWVLAGPLLVVSEQFSKAAAASRTAEEVEAFLSFVQEAVRLTGRLPGVLCVDGDLIAEWDIFAEGCNSLAAVVTLTDSPGQPMWAHYTKWLPDAAGVLSASSPSSDDERRALSSPSDFVAWASGAMPVKGSS